MTANVSGQYVHLDAIGTAQADESQGGRQLLGVVQLGWVAEIHRCTCVDQREEVQVLLFQKQLEKQAVEPSVEIPIDEAQIVAGDIIAEVGELDALPFAAAATFTFHPSAKDLATHQLQPLQLSQQFGASSKGRGCHGVIDARKNRLDDRLRETACVADSQTNRLVAAVVQSSSAFSGTFPESPAAPGPCRYSSACASKFRITR